MKTWYLMEPEICWPQIAVICLSKSLVTSGCVTLQAMANDSDLNIENNIRKRDTQFINIFWLKTLENQIKCILLCILLEHTGGINVCFGMEHGLKHRKKRHNDFVRCFSTNN